MLQPIYILIVILNFAGPGARTDGIEFRGQSACEAAKEQILANAAQGGKAESDMLKVFCVRKKI